MTTPYGVEPAPSPTRSEEHIEFTVENISKFAKQVTLLKHPELVFALVRTLGSSITAVVQELKSHLAASGYAPQDIKLSALLDAKSFKDEADRYEQLMTEGDKTRGCATNGDAVARLAIKRIRSLRKLSYQRNSDRPTAWIIDSLMHPKEVETLRGVYGPRLFVIACDAPRHERHSTLKRRFSQGSGLSEADADLQALRLINRDAGITPPTRGVKKRFCLATGKTLELADAFVRTDETNNARTVIRRLVQCIFGHPFFNTPTPDEFGMAVAFQAALTTASLARRVGAALVVNEQLISIGTNEVPKTGGHVYNAESQPDGREWVEGQDPSDSIRVGILSDLFRRLQSSKGWLADRRLDQNLRDLTIEALKNADLMTSQLFDVIEYSRTAHAEMVAITGAARLGISIEGGTLYTTTQPCHECTRNIIASGLARVVYVEPYPKSRGAELQSDSMVLVAYHGEHERKIGFELFSGISYRRFPDLFSWVPRKEDDRLREVDPEATNLTFDGSSVNWIANEAQIRSSILNPDFCQVELLGQNLREALIIGEL